MPMFSTPLSGLNASSNALSVISNNLANLNTVGFKEQTASFQDLFYQNIGATGGGNPIQVGAGSAVGAVTSDFTNGNFDTSGVPHRRRHYRRGFLRDPERRGLGFTRNGHFTLQSDGELDTQDGRAVMGYPAINGAIDTSQNLAPIVLGQGLISPPLATSNLQMTSNLDASAAVGATFSTPMSVFDTLGVSHILTFQFTKTGANSWSYNTTIAAPEVGLTAELP